jgi:short-subunit dehydrogenase involved in D-alanine esterification of teichoic acids
MKKKDLKKFAKRLAELETIIQTSDDYDKRQLAQNEVLDISNKITDVEDMLTLDAMVQEILEKNS